MAQHDYVIDNASGAVVRSDINNALAAIATWNSGASAPSPAYAHQRWVDTTNNVVRRRNAANSAWIDWETALESFLVTRSSNVQLTRADRFPRAIRATASFTQTLDACSSLGDGWSLPYIIDSGVTITFDPNGSEQIDGATTKAFTGPTSGWLHCNGSEIRTSGFASVSTLTNPTHTAQTLTDGATINWDTNSGHIASVTIAGNRTMAAPTNLKNAGLYTLHVIQDSTGGRTLTWNSAFKGLNGGGMDQPDPRANARTTYEFVSDGTNLYCVSRSVGVNLRSVVSLSGTSVDITGIPAGVRRITLMHHNMSSNGSSHFLLQLGTSSGFNEAAA
ncbi:MAG: hypothetical protein NZ518_08130, partial [Dehalococcoidia bacterium]|nr:hypothetical protein [Dehalococcoidia bacterium]